MAWPPILDDLKVDLGIELDDRRDDSRLSSDLGAAVAFVEEKRPDLDYTGDPESQLPEPTATVVTGTLRLAGRWYRRRRSPDGLVEMAELGVSRVPSVDPDIERMLGIGRYRGPVVA